ncbi:hypothetical protein KP509_03G036200 [Ceratopteris richardii]|uniref:PROP1-like PPR domain-containing protein n=1 Tax=Ceratopteris richardii TaxID=49495 RepID=A0A8T2V6B0_CERRI|nr:hypothetical protein KP509_03G036200 [Ceratopteris richardii]
MSMKRLLYVVSCTKRLAHLKPAETLNFPVYSFSVQERFICSQVADQTETSDSHQRKRLNGERRPNHKITLFLRKTVKSYNLLNLLNANTWDDATAKAIQSSEVELDSFVVCQIIKLCANLDTALEFYRWWRTSYGDKGMSSHLYTAIMHRLGRVHRIEEMEAVANECESNCMVTVATFTVQLAAYKSVGDLDRILSTWKHMEKFGLKPSALAYATLMDAFSNMKMYEAVADLYLLFLSKGFLPSVRIIFIFIHHLVMAGKMDSAMAIYNDLRKLKIKPNIFIYSSLLKGFADVGDINSVLNLVQELKDLGIRPHRTHFKFLFMDMLLKNRKGDALKIMHEMWPELSREDLNSLISFYLDAARNEQGNYDEGFMSEGSDVDDDKSNYEISQKFPSDPIAVWNFNGFIRHLTPWSAATAIALENAEVKWDGHIVTEIMKRIDSVDVAWKFFSWVEGQQGFSHDKFTYMAMIRLLLKDGNFATVKQLLMEAQSKKLNLSLHTYNNVLHVCAIKQKGNAALDIFDLLDSAGLKPDIGTYEKLIRALYKCGRYWRAATVFAEMQKAGFTPKAVTYSLVICGFAEAGQMKYARAYYSKMRACGLEPSSQIFSAFISGYYRIGKLERAEKFFQQMRRHGLEPSAEVYDQMIKVFKRAGKKVELHQTEQARESLPSSKFIERQRRNDAILRSYQIFKDSLEENDDIQMFAAG